jgi:GT2 family glycosyltransferase
MVARDPVPKVRVVVLNYNGGDLTRQCLASLAATRWPADALEVVLVDNASTDDSVAPALAEHPATRLIARTDNGGFPANNDALRDLEGVDYVALVNNDAFVEPDWLAPLVATLEADPALGAACPKILFVERAVDGRPLVNNVGNDVLPNGYGVDRGFGEPDDGRFDEPVDVFAWCGAGVLLRSDYLRDVGLFDERRRFCIMSTPPALCREAIYIGVSPNEIASSCWPRTPPPASPSGPGSGSRCRP